MTLRSWEDVSGEVELEADVVIVGTGPGGAAAARVLAEGGRRVVMLEEGPARPRFAPNYANIMRYHMQEGGSMVALGDAAIGVAAGRGVGGGTLVNSAICWRTPDAVLEGWTEVLGGDARFRPQAMAPVYDEISEIIGVTKTNPDIAGENNLLIVRGARALGLEADLLHRNTPGCVGCGICNLGCPSGGKASVDRNLIPMARAAGALVQGDTKVTKILVEGGRARGVSGLVRHTDDRRVVGTVTVRADTVVLAAGAVGTPRLLHVAGLADQLGPRVGKGLHLHPGNAVMGLCDHEVRMWKGATQGAYFLDPDLPDVLPHTLSMPPGALLMMMGGQGSVAKERLRQMGHMAGCLVMVSDKGEGTVSANADGTANLSYYFEDVDIQNMRAGLKRTCEVLLAGGVKRLLVPIVGVGWVDGIDEAFAAIDAADVTRYQGMYAAHPMATCRMGQSLDDSVVAPDGQAHGLPGLYITDSSIFPTSLGVNPQLTTMAMATILAEGMLG
ncbi:MAG: GMC family oxidoreductase [Alphaproteobacteria bacterium]|nr:GMC family oxidoreductase [Alphaproteobacteria bacterium]